MFLTCGLSSWELFRPKFASLPEIYTLRFCETSPGLLPTSLPTYSFFFLSFPFFFFFFFAFYFLLLFFGGIENIYNSSLFLLDQAPPQNQKRNQSSMAAVQQAPTSFDPQTAQNHQDVSSFSFLTCPWERQGEVGRGTEYCVTSVIAAVGFANRPFLLQLTIVTTNNLPLGLLDWTSICLQGGLTRTNILEHSGEGQGIRIEAHKARQWDLWALQGRFLRHWCQQGDWRECDEEQTGQRAMEKIHAGIWEKGKLKAVRLTVY